MFDIETGSYDTLLDANPQGWDHVEEAEAAKTWCTIMGLDVIQQGALQRLPACGVGRVCRGGHARSWVAVRRRPEHDGRAWRLDGRRKRCARARRCIQSVPWRPAPSAASTIVAGDNFGRVHFLDPRLPTPVACLQLHKKNGKVGWRASVGKGPCRMPGAPCCAPPLLHTFACCAAPPDTRCCTLASPAGITLLQVQSVHCNPVDPHLVLTAGNDYTARVLDIRNLMAGERHGRWKAVEGAGGGC